MSNDFLAQLSLAYENRDLVALTKLTTPSVRHINKKNDFHSALMLSCNNIKHLTKIESLESECIILNLEDGVSKEDKPFALILCGIFLSEHESSDKKLVVRVNALNDGGYEEIKYLNQFMPDAIRVPKIKNRDDVESVLSILNTEIDLHLSIETAQAWHNLSSLGVNKRVSAFYLGVLDLFADMGLSHSLIKRDNPTMLYMLAHFLVTCKSMGVKPVSFVYQEFKNLEEFSMWISLEKSMGYEAKGCISPKQVKFVNKTFVNEEAQIKRAEAIIKLFEMYRANGITGFVDEKYGFIDEPIYKGALLLLAK